MRVSPAVPAACAAVALLAAVGTPALAADGSRPAAGSAASAVSLLNASVAGHDLAAGGVQLVTDTVSGAVAKVVVTPLVADGTAYGQQTVPAGTSRSIDGADSSTLVPALKGVVGVTSPVLEVGAKVVDGAPTAVAGASSLGALSVLGLPVTVDGVLKTSSAVSGTAAQSTKTLEISDVALPSIADLLAALGLDLSKLPVATVQALVTQLDLVTPTVAAAQKALDDAQALLKAQTDAATAEVAKQVAAVAAATKGVTAATAALDPLTSGVLGSQAAQDAANAAVATANATLAQRQVAAAAARTTLDAAKATVAGLPVLGTLPTVKAAADAAVATASAALTEADALVAQAQAAADKAAADVAAAKSVSALTDAAIAAAQDAVRLAQSALASANRLLDAAQAAVTGIVASVAPQVKALLDTLVAVLDGTPLVSLDSLSLTTESVVTSDKAGGQKASVKGGEVQGLHVLGTDVLDDVLGSSTLDVTALTGTTLAKVTDAITGLTGTLSQVLSTVPGLPALKVPAPQVQLLTKSSSTSVADGFGNAATSLTGLKVTVPAITLPSAVALPSALSLPGLSVLPAAALPAGLTDVGTVLTSSPTTLGFGTLVENARFRPAVGAAAAPSTSTPTTAGRPTVGRPAVPAAVPAPAGSLPRTGTSGALAGLAFVLVAGAVVLRRRELGQQ